MIYRIFSDKDTFITDAFMNARLGNQGTGPRATGSNIGLSEIADIFYRTGSRGTENARILTQFNVQPFQDLIDKNLISSSGDGVKYYLRFYNAVSDETLPRQFTLKVFPVSSSGQSDIWREGPGFDNDHYLDSGVANWISASKTYVWTNEGGDSFSGSAAAANYYGSASQYFNLGGEDLEVEVTDIVNNWLSGNIPNNGFTVRLTASQTTGSATSESYYIKRFHTRHTNFLNKRPYLEARFESNIFDRRGDYLFDQPNEVYAYNIVRGQPADLGTGSADWVVGTGASGLTGSVKVLIKSGSAVVAHATGSRQRKGVYKFSLELTSSTLRNKVTGNIFQDIWFSGSSTDLQIDSSATIFFSGSFTGSQEGFESTLNPVTYNLQIPNLRKLYGKGEFVRLNVTAKKESFNVSVLSTGSATIDNNYLEKCYYRIIEEDSKDVIIPFHTASGGQYTRLSFDGKSNFIEFYMNSLTAGNLYRLEFLLDEDGYKQVLTDTFKFKVD